MPTLQENETTISAQALSLLGCYASGMNEVIYRFAKAIAGARQAGLQFEGEPIRIVADDVRKAADLLTEAAMEHFDAEPGNEQYIQALQGLHECLKNQLVPEGKNPR